LSPPVAGFVLAGGRSSRMGRDKTLLELNGETLVQLALRKLTAVCAEVAIAGGGVELDRIARVIPDSTPGCGPLGGIVAALEQSLHEWNLFLAVDMPFVPVEALRTLVAAAGGEEMVLLAQADGYVQPLCGIYSRRALPALREELNAGRLKVKDAVAATRAVSYVEFAEVGWFRNLNTPEDFRAAQGFYTR
jgi:molybdopterin-guanine dinucleotide biosynthesis protein A